MSEERGDEPSAKKRRVESSSDESRIGILCSVLQLRALPFTKFVASLKTLYTDFVVREISTTFNDRKPLRLVPESAGSVVRTVVPSAERGAEERSFEGFSAEDRALFSSLVDEAELSELEAFFQRRVPKVPFVFKPCVDKATRTALHQALKASAVGRFYVSSTTDGVVKLDWATNQKRREEERRQQPVSRKPYTHFTLMKQNVDSYSALRIIAQQTGISARSLQISGTKDKRAVTFQRVACRGLDERRLGRLNALQSFGRNAIAKLGSFEQRDEGLSLGDLVGNHFEIVLRLTSSSPAPPSPAMLLEMEKALRTDGFINYFGPQRFGTTSVLTSDIGGALIANDYREVARLILLSRLDISPETRPAYEAFAGGDAEAALALLPHYCFSERDILKHLVRCPNDFLGAFSAIPRTLVMLYCHSVQSLIWNLAVSERIIIHGLKPVVGDLVYDDSCKVAAPSTSADSVAGTTAGDECGQAFEDAIPSEALDEAPAEISAPLRPVRLLTQADVDSGRYSMCDVVMPVPGPDPELRYPETPRVSRSTYEGLMAHHSVLGLVDPLHPLVKMYHFHGTYRSVCHIPDAFSLRVVAMRSPREQVTVVEFGQRSAAEPAADSGAESGTFAAVVAEFSLGAGSYATSVLREFCVTTRD